MAFFTSNSNVGTYGAGMTIGVPASVVVNHILLIGFGIDTSSPGTITWPTGFALLDSIRSPATPDGQSGGIAWKLAVGTEASTTLTITGNGGIPSAQTYCTGIIVLEGRSTSVGPTAAGTTNTASNTSPVSISAASVTALDGDDEVWWSMPDVSVSGAGNGHTPPTNFTERIDVETGFANLGVATRDNIAAGATGAVVGSFALTSGVAGYAAFNVRVPVGAASVAQQMAAINAFAAAGGMVGRRYL